MEVTKDEQMTKEELVQSARKLYDNPWPNEALKKVLEEIFPELKESEDERIRKILIKRVRTAEELNEELRECIIAYLEKQKEQTEELSIRLNGLMQEYVKAGKDEEEQEHRLKCYQLFWDALGDSEFFKQKEQKPIKVYDNMDDLIADAMIDEISKSDMLDSCKHNRVYWINKHRQKSAECVADSIKFDEGFKTGHEVGFCEGVETSKPADWMAEVQQQPLVWKRIKRGERLPCRAYLYKLAYEQKGNFHGVATVDGFLVPNDPVCVGCDTWYLPADAVKNLPKEGQR